MKRIKEIRDLSRAELAKKEDELQKELVKLRAQSAIGTQIKNPSQLRNMRRTVARIRTVMKETEKNKA